MYWKQNKQGPTRHRPMAHPVVFRYLSYSTTLSEHAVHRLRRCQAFGRAGTCLFPSVQLDGQWVSDPPTGWPHDHGPTNVRAMVKITMCTTCFAHCTLDTAHFTMNTVYYTLNTSKWALNTLYSKSLLIDQANGENLFLARKQIPALKKRFKTCQR